MKRTLRVIDGTATAVPPRRSAMAAAYDHFRLDRQGNLMSANTLEAYEWAFTVFSEWLESARRRRSGSSARAPPRMKPGASSRTVGEPFDDTKRSRASD